MTTGPAKIEADFIALKTLFAHAGALHGRTGPHALRWGLTEMNVTYANPDREISGIGNVFFLGGQFVAEIFGLGMKHGATLLNQWCINETDSVRTDFGYLGLPGEFYPRSSYYHMQLMSAHLGGMYLSSSDNQDTVKTVASADPDHIAVLVLNQDPTETFAFEVNFGPVPSHSAPLQIQVDTAFAATHSGSIPPQTSQLLLFNLDGSWQEGWIYGIAQNLKYSGPEPMSR
ncbi:MAG: hypothetical protein J6386_18980 [Candidatus Synoicihabitans palmerolidicus]|nr:hypothetical protein [Candidatus Synoicihabitans palmerolidicus]